MEISATSDNATRNRFDFGGDQIAVWIKEFLRDLSCPLWALLYFYHRHLKT